ncbi:EAL domain-containing protein [Vibrio sp. CAU 1672]|uniref:EAL domain-containing protein n=1 Tax=Vibrio sp. CAU 1672 TaxID=3032594 RepID=UPI0023DBB05A|nr:EAL domain-containing protein [Vibrio sp. CAU 1672]MDF2154819.1 EAL domain-containing protein [Vibrio sp. CAU 1672]
MMGSTQLLSCISTQEDGQFIASYRGLTLRSVFQPIYQRELQIIGLEALVRIVDRNNLMLRPDLFFHSDAVPTADKLNVERLSRLIHIANFAQSKFSDRKLFLNVLPQAAEMLAKDRNYCQLLQHSISQANLKQEQIVMELVELSASDESALHQATQKLSSSGYLLAIDDYGVNASTIERVKRVRPHIIKIDRSLLLKYEEGDVGHMMQALKLATDVCCKTVIEGIETEHQLSLMKKLGFDMYQGYLLAMPEPLKAFSTAKSA